MPRIACLMMQRDEDLLLRPWLLYHGYLFGFENLYVFDNGSASDIVQATLREFAPLGVNVDYSPAAPKDFEDKGEVVGRKIAEFRQDDRYDIAVPLDCDEFLAIRGDDGISCRRSEILGELHRISSEQKVCRTDHCLDNWPGHIDLFRYVGHVKSIVIVPSFTGIDHGFHQADLPAGGSYGTTALVHIHFHFRPFARLLESCRNKLRPYVDISDLAALQDFGGVGIHLKKYFFMTAADYYAGMAGYDHFLLRFRDLARLLGVLMDIGPFQRAWEAGRPGPSGTHHGVNRPEIDLDTVPFRWRGYLGGNPDLPDDPAQLFDHFVRAGYREGRWLDTSSDAPREVVERLAMFRATIRDGAAGYAGLTLALSRLGRVADSEALIAAGISELGETATLLREYALSAMYCGQKAQAAERWRRFRTVFPDLPEGYVYGAQASLQAGGLDDADRIALEGLRRFPLDAGLMIRRVDIAVERREWAQVKALWNELVLLAPDSREVKDRAGSIVFQIRNWETLDLEGEAEVEPAESPVIIEMSERETEQALQFLALRHTHELRDFFLSFESIGNSCEFGLVQRHYGAEPISLLRWNSLTSRNLLKALEEGFAGIDDPDRMRCEVIRGEYIIRDSAYHTAMHTFVSENTIAAGQFLAQQIRRVKFLRGKLLADLGNDEKIFVHLEEGALSDAELERLRRAFRGYGNGRLLYVRVAAPHQPSGVVGAAGDGLLVGTVARPGRDATDTWNIDFPSWIALCRAAGRHWQAHPHAGGLHGRPHGQWPGSPFVG